MVVSLISPDKVFWKTTVVTYVNDEPLGITREFNHQLRLAAPAGEPGMALISAVADAGGGDNWRDQGFTVRLLLVTSLFLSILPHCHPIYAARSDMHKPITRCYRLP